MNNLKHPLTGFSEDEQIEYLCVMASLMAADARITDEELTRLREFCETLGISGLGIGRILSAAEDSSVIDFPAVFGRIARTDLRFALFADLIFMAYADGMLAPPELSEIHVIAARLGISPDQMKAVSRYVAGVFAEQSGNPARADWRAESANALTEAGVPLSVMAIAGGAAAKPSRSARILGLRW